MYSTYVLYESLGLQFELGLNNIKFDFVNYKFHVIKKEKYFLHYDIITWSTPPPTPIICEITYTHI